MKRRADVAGIFPGEAPIARPIGAVLPEADDGRQPRHRCMRVEAAAELAAPATEPEPAQLPPRAA